MKPYYDEGGITIYHGDCREILPTLPKVDCFVTDPPYGVSFDGKATKWTVQKTGGYTIPDSDIGPGVVAAILSEVERGAVFPGTRLMFAYPNPADIGCVYCPSGAGIGRWGFTCFHPVLFYGARPNTVLTPSSIQSFDTSDDVDHPCPKPLTWLRWLVGKVSNVNETVLDPFMGSGTTLWAAKQLGRRAIGIEIEEKYCEIAVKRLAQQVFDFAEPAPLQKQGILI